MTELVDQVDDDVPDDGDDDDAPQPRRLGPVLASVGVLVFVLLLFVVLATREPAENRLADSPLIGRPAPAVSGATLDGGTFDLDAAPGRYVLVNFLASWCQPCQLEHDDLIAFSRRHEAAGDAGIVSVVFDDTTENVRAYFEERGGDWPVIVGDEGDIALDYGVIKLPETFVVGPDGTVLYRIAGPASVEGLDALIADLEGLTP